MATTLAITVQTEAPGGTVRHLEIVLSPPMQLADVENMALRIAADASAHIHAAPLPPRAAPAAMANAAAGAGSTNTGGGGGGRG